MNEIRRDWSDGTIRNRVLFRAWGRAPGLWPLRYCKDWPLWKRLWGCLFETYLPNWRPEFEWRTVVGFNGECYCYNGSETILSFAIASFGFRLWWSRASNPRPCSCDKALHDYFHVELKQECDCGDEFDGALISSTADSAKEKK